LDILLYGSKNLVHMLDCQDGIELQEGSYSAIAVDQPRSRTRLGELEWGVQQTPSLVVRTHMHHTIIFGYM